ncbi:CorA family divalent cation transporter [Clostridium cylindrosporum]|uniref:Mg2+ transporter protein CorA n=1 Tax=Clostridium cylindrosporum DSM 605 TaxID=1121307 RepID=A0A0J8D7I6_CLOCY|nr:CorA family divalent cation transporter [Clostridium cylindrosporum]KMT21857.1 Mg2+ transporter protein CorA [Clostridium cylindrosporum DSM 605]
MLYKINGSSSEAIELNQFKDKDSNYIGVFTTKKLEKVFQKFSIRKSIIDEFKVSKQGKFESHEGFDLIFLNVINKNDVTIFKNRILIYLDKGKMLLFCDDEKILGIITEYITESDEEITLEKTLYYILKQLTLYDSDILGDIEERISSLEDELLEGGSEDYIKEIIVIRRKIMILKSYYEQFYTVLDGLQENENNLLSKNILRYFKIFSNRIDRLSQKTLNLREYITQVREAYQAQVDISLNKIMKIFTVITAIFLPLSLIAAWYGMNLKMPEFNWVYGYPFVIILSLVVVGVSIIYFKKQKWF